MTNAASRVRADVAGFIVAAGSGKAGSSSIADYTGVAVHSRYGCILMPARPPLIERLPTPPRPPRPPRFFRGYGAEQSLLQDEIVSGRGAWISGPGGCGSSALLRQAINTPAARSLPDGVAYVMGEEEPPIFDDILQRLFQRFYTSDITVWLTPPIIQTHLADVQTLFVLDRLPLSHAELQRLSDTLSDNGVLVVADPPAPDSLLDLHLAGLAPGDALTLSAAAALLEIDRPGVREALEKLCVLLDYLPLPLLLLARSVGGDMARLTTMLEELERLSAEPTPLVRALRVLLSFMHPDERAALAALLGAGGSDAALETLVAISKRPAATLQKALERLAPLGLVEIREQRSAIASISLRQGLEQVIQPHEERRRALDYFLQTLAVPPDTGWIERELSSLLLALQTALHADQVQQVGVLAQAVQPVLVLRGWWGQWEQVLEWAERAARITSDQALSAWVLHERGTRASLLGNRKAAAAALHNAWRLRRRLGDTAAAEVTYHNLAYLDLLPPAAPRTRASTSYTRPRLSLGHWLIGTLPILLLLLSTGVQAFFPGVIPGDDQLGAPPTITLVAAVLEEATRSATPAPPIDSTAAAGTAAPVLVSATPTRAPTLARTPTPSPTFTPERLPASPTATAAPSATTTPVAPSATPSRAALPTATQATTLPTTPAAVGTSTLAPSLTPEEAPQDESEGEFDEPLFPDNTPTFTAEPDQTPASDESAEDEQPAATLAPDSTPSATRRPSATPTPEDQTAPLSPELLEPEDEATLDCANTVTFTIMLQWEAVEDPAGIVGYDWVLEESPDNSEDSFTTSTTNTAEDTSAEAAVRCGRWYRWQVRAVDGADNVGNYSPYHTFFVELARTPTPTPDKTPPDAPDPIQPADNEVFDCNASVELSWSIPNDASDIDRYEWELDISTDGRDGAYSLTRNGDVEDPFVTLSSLKCPADTTWYRWRVRAVDGADNTGDFFAPEAHFQMQREPE